jgi:hypothetical protein
VSNEYKIEKNVPLPRGTVHNGSFLNAMRQMQIGDSMIISEGKRSANAYNCACRLNYKISMRRQPDGTYRMWRVA